MDAMKSEKLPVIGSDVPRRYMGESADDVLNGSLSRRLSRETSLDVLLQDRITLTWSNLNVYVVPDTRNRSFRCCGDTPADVAEYKQILHNVSGIAKPGQLLAILAASGAGKTTLLNVLNQRNISRLLVEGKLLVNGVQVGDAKAMGALSGYVQQDDLFIGTLTVAEHLRFQAMLRMDRHLSNDERNKKVDELIYELGLTKCANTLIGNPPRIRGISDGERKRLAFASEALTNPSLLFCDEPTSGLDSFMAESVVTSLKKLASRGRTVICTIHQPSSQVFAMFDRVLLMSEGRIAYLGPTSDMCDFFLKVGSVCPPNFNPADFYIHQLAIVPGRDTESRQFVQEVCSTYESSPQFSELLSEIQAAEDLAESNEILVGNLTDGSPYKSSRWRQFVTVLWRSSLTNRRDPLLLRGRLSQALVISLLLGLVYLQQSYDQEGVMNINGCLFLMQTQMSAANVVAVVNTFLSERLVLFREHHNGMYHVWIYFVCKMIAEMLIFITMPVIFTVITYWMVGLYNEAGAFFIATITMILTANVAVSFGYLVSCSTDQVSMALSLVPVCLVPITLFGGYFLNIDSVPVYFLWLKYISWFNYSNEIMVVNQWKRVTNLTCEYSSTNMANDRCLSDGEDVIVSFSYSEDKLVEDFIALVALLVAFRLVSYILLYLRTRNRE